MKHVISQARRCISTAEWRCKNRRSRDWYKRQPKGEVIDHQIAETVIRVDKRMSYTGVSKVLAEEPEALEEDKDFVPMIQKLSLIHI